MDLEDVKALDAPAVAELTFLVTDIESGTPVKCRFAPLALSDVLYFNREPWSGSVFADYWDRAAALSLGALKLMRSDSLDAAPLGLVKPGKINWVAGPLMGSVLESSPMQRYGAFGRLYKDVGCALVARLVVESLQQGGHGRLLIRARPDSEGFYLRLGFRLLLRRDRRLLLGEAEARSLLEKTLCGWPIL